MENSFSNSNQSGKRRVGFAFILAVVLGACVVTELRAQLVVVPNVLATNDGDSSFTAEGSVVLRLMQIFDSSQFGDLSGPSSLIQLALRPDTIPGSSGPRTQTLRVYASTTSRSVDEMSTTFADNLGANNTLIFDGILTLSTENLSGPGDTRLFDLVYPFTTPFLYNPAAGNLLLDLQISSDIGAALRWDSVTAGNLAIRCLSGVGSATAPAGRFTDSPVWQLTFAAPALATIRVSQVEVCWNSQSNVTYQVQYRSDLTTNLWTSLGDCILSTNSTSCVSDPIVVGQPQRFYRVVLTNCVP